MTRRCPTRPGMNFRANSENPLERVKDGISLVLNPLWVSAISLGIHSEVG
jgi:hypothetical protein